MRKTNKLYYSHQHVKEIQAKIVNIYKKSKTIELDRTIAYPEGGGQESDKCFIEHIKTGNIFPIEHVKRIYGRDIKINESHYVNVDGIILHQISRENDLSLDKIDEGDTVKIEINTLLREKLTTSHSASHLLYVAIKKIRNDAIAGTIGCHIKEGQARFDFRVDHRFSEQEIKNIEAVSNEFIQNDYKIRVYPSEKHPDARFWECQNNIIPCGGTHLKKTGTIGFLKVKRKNIGKGKERIICILENPSYNIEQYVGSPDL